MNKKYIMVGIAILGFSAYSLIRTRMNEKQPSLVTHSSGLQTIILKEAPQNAPDAKKGNQVQVHYTGWLYDTSKPESKGTKFDSSVDRGQPFQFTLGAGMVIRGWDEGVAMMKRGEKRRFIIPPHLAYGSRGVGSVIRPNSTLVFDVELLA